MGDLDFNQLLFVHSQSLRLADVKGSAMVQLVAAGTRGLACPEFGRSNPEC